MQILRIFWLLSLLASGCSVNSYAQEQVEKNEEEVVKPLVLQSSDYILIEYSLKTFPIRRSTFTTSYLYRIVDTNYPVKGQSVLQSSPREIYSGDLVMLEEVSRYSYGEKVNSFTVRSDQNSSGEINVHRLFTITFTQENKTAFTLSIKKGGKEFFVSNEVASGRLGLTDDKSLALNFLIKLHFSPVNFIKNLNGRGYLYLIRHAHAHDKFFIEYLASEGKLDVASYQAAGFQNNHKLNFSQMVKPKEDVSVNYLGGDAYPFLYDVFDDGSIAIKDEQGRFLIVSEKDGKRFVYFKELSKEVEPFKFWDIGFSGFGLSIIEDNPIITLKNKKTGFYLAVDGGGKPVLDSSIGQYGDSFVLSINLPENYIFNKKGPTPWHDPVIIKKEPRYKLEDESVLKNNTIMLSYGDWIKFGVKEFNKWFQLQFVGSQLNKDKKNKILQQVRIINKEGGDVVACEKYNKEAAVFSAYKVFTLNDENPDPEQKGKLLFSLSVKVGEKTLFARLADDILCEPGEGGLFLLLTLKREEATIFGIKDYFSPSSYVSRLGKMGYFYSEIEGKMYDFSSFEKKLVYQPNQDGSKKTRDQWSIFNFDFSISSAQDPLISIKDSNNNFLYYEKRKNDEGYDLVFGPLKDMARRYWRIWPTGLGHELEKNIKDSLSIELAHDATGIRLDTSLEVDRKELIDEKTKKVFFSVSMRDFNTFKLEAADQILSEKLSPIEIYIESIIGDGYLLGLNPSGKKTIINTEAGKIFTIIPGTEKECIQIKINKDFVILSESGDLMIASPQDLIDEKKRDWSVILNKESQSISLIYQATGKMLFIPDLKNAVGYAQFQFSKEIN